MMFNVIDRSHLDESIQAYSRYTDELCGSRIMFSDPGDLLDYLDNIVRGNLIDEPTPGSIIMAYLAVCKVLNNTPPSDPAHIAALILHEGLEGDRIKGVVV